MFRSVSSSSRSAEVSVEKAAPRERKRSFDPKYLVCGLLVIQNTGAVVAMRFTRSMPGQGQFSPETAVIMQECLKGMACILLLLREQGTIKSAFEKPAEALKTSVPALLYLVQNNLQYVAVTYLDAATYTVSYQTKILWSGILSVILLKRKLSLHKWLGLCLLALGVACVQLSRMESNGGREGQFSSTTGMTAVISAAMVSALAGVYFEKILKGAKVGLWTRNLQLAGYSVLVGYVKLASSEQGAEMRAGRLAFFYGYTKMTWTCVAVNAFGGLLVGMVIRYADAVMKDVALGCSIVLSSLISTFLFNFHINTLFSIGVAAVIYSVFLYGERATCFGAVPIIPAPAPASENQEHLTVVAPASSSSPATKKKQNAMTMALPLTTNDVVKV